MSGTQFFEQQVVIATSPGIDRVGSIVQPDELISGNYRGNTVTGLFKLFHQLSAQIPLTGKDQPPTVVTCILLVP